MHFALTEQQKELQSQIHRFAQGEIAPRAEELDRKAEFPVDLFQRVGEMGVMSIPFPEELGGMGLGVFDAVLAIEALAEADQSIAVSAMVSMAAGLTVSRFGSEEQKKKWLPDIISGQKICAIAGTEPDAGSDTGGFTTRAKQLGNGQWSLSGEKAYITNPGTPISLFTLILAITSPKEDERKKFSLFLTPNDAPGYTRGKSYNKMGWRSSDTRPLYLDDCQLGDDAIVGDLDGGRHLLHKGYQAARIWLAACSLGLAQASLKHAVAYATERQAFGGSIGRLQMVQQMIAQMAIKVDTARLLTYRAAWQIDQGIDDLGALSMAKMGATEIGTEVANLAVQVSGGWGFMDDCPASRYLRDNRICTIGDGSSQIQTMLIARSCGLDVNFT
ncbi:acyl-CoA dehydrogenase family protein [Marinobacter sp. ATCH36]|uniref:acyl-CoA dehydrogenase family protein n=1 Tax=Marinobacter sp. ATCH36 TaxID=2945106 RepID=UPI0020218B3E|nr:acyl-CoA dehydrogenase family protein [Marinobacter sp. ATCH36]MCL7946164.1 acyl-CoA dehydrogenase family protein [Marinobacter sp. ATCH36]